MFGNTQYTLLDIQELYGFYSVEKTIQALWKADARLTIYSTDEVTAYGEYTDIEKDEHQQVLEKSKLKNKNKFQIKLPPALYRLCREKLDDYFNFEKRKFIPKETIDIIQPKIGSMTVKGYLHYDLYPENILVDEIELFTALGPPPPKDIKHPFYFAFEQDAKEWRAIYECHYWIVAKDFSYYQIPNFDRVELVGIKKEFFKHIFHHHCDKHGLSFNSGDLMAKIELQHAYKSFSDFRSKNPDFKEFILKVNNRGKWRMKFPIFNDYIDEIILSN
jgi:hypothetical protein